MILLESLIQSGQKENNMEEKEKQNGPQIPVEFYLPEDFAEKFRELIIEMGIVGRPVEDEHTV